MNSHRRQLQALRDSLPPLHDDGQRLVIFSRHEWPDEDNQAYDRAYETGDQETRAELIERHTGQRLSRTAEVHIVELIRAPDGPQ